jgi:hypothetical protein
MYRPQATMSSKIERQSTIPGSLSIVPTHLEQYDTVKHLLTSAYPLEVMASVLH